MSPVAHAIIEILADGCLILLCFKFYKDKRRNLENGKIEVKFTEEDFDEETNETKFKYLVLEINYRLIKGSRRNKEQAAIEIESFIRSKCASKSFRIRNNSKRTFKEIKDIMGKIRPLLSRETDSELTDVNYRISEKTIPQWSEGVFLKA